MGNAEYDTPTSGDLADGDKDGREILEGLRSYLREIGSAVGALEKDSRDVGGPRLRRRVARLAAIMREGNDVTDGYVRAAEKWSSGFDSITRRDLAAAPAMSDITPDTHIRMSTAKFIALIVALIGVVAGGVTGWVTLTSSIAIHVHDTSVHLDPDYQKDHGRPIGKWDIEAYKSEVGRRLDAHDEKLDRILNLLVNKPDQPPRRKAPQ